MDQNVFEKKILDALKTSTADEKNLILKIKAHFKKAGKKTAVIGLSGGVDSSLVCYLAAKALGKENVFAYYMPYVYDEKDEKDIEQLVKLVGVIYKKIDLRGIVDKICETIKPRNTLAAGNIRARARMITLYSFANGNDALVLGTGNRTELLLGYFTKYGDGACDLLPIGKLYKLQVWDMARLSKLPKHIIDKVPTAGLCEGQTDESELGVTYMEIDKILAAHFELGMPWKEIEGHFVPKKVLRVRELHETSFHKRINPEFLEF